MPYIGRDLNRGNYLKLDDISSSFNGSTQTFNLTVGGSAFRPGSAFSILVSVGGVIQEPESAYQINNSEITFANAPTAQDGFFCLALAIPIGIGVPGNGTVNGTQMAKPFNYDGFFFLDDANNRVGIGSLQPKQALDVIGNANISGILTASSFSGGSGGVNAGVITCTGLDLNGNGDVSGNFVIGGDLTVNGTTSTIDTNLIGVDRVEVGANSNTVTGIAVTQSGTADIVRLYDGSTQVVTVDDTGKVGIGTAVPDGNLTIHGASGGNPGLLLRRDTGGGDIASISWRSNTASFAMINYRDAAPHGLQFYSGGTASSNLSMIIRLNGNVGIGSEIPGQKLDVSGTILTRSSANTATFSHNTLQFQTSGGAHIDHGTTNQNLNFRVSKSSTADTTMVQVNAAAEQTKFRKIVTVGLQGGDDIAQIGGGSGIGAYLQLNHANNNIVNTKLMGNNTSWLNSHYGNLGIGTQTPNAKFVVSNAGANGFEFNPNFNSNNSIIASYNRSGGGSYTQLTLSASQHIFAQGGSEYGRFDASGRLLIGTTTEGNAESDDLTIATSGSTGITVRSGTSGNGNLYFSDGTSGDDEYRGSIQYQHANDALVFATNAVERLRIGSNGSVGIGTDYLSGNATTYHKLMVEGDTTSTIAVAKIVRKNSSASNSTYTFEVDSSAHGSNMSSGGAMAVDVYSGRAFTIDGNGKVGIGTELPEYLTTIAAGSGNSKLNLKRLNAASNGNAFGSIFYTNMSGTDVASVRAHRQSAADDAYLGFATRNAGGSITEKVRIESGGGLKFTGQGTSIPTGGILHHTNNNLYVRGGTNGLILGNDNNYTTVQIYDSYIKFETDDGSERFRIDSSGHLKHTGLRTGNSQNKLARLITPSYNTSEEDVALYIAENESSSNQISFGGGTSSYNAATRIRFLTAAAVNTVTGEERVAINSTGNIGVNCGKTTLEGGVDIGTSGLTANTNTPLIIGTEGGQNRFLRVNFFGNQQNFHSLTLRCNDNGIMNQLDISNPFGGAGYGSGIRFTGYNNDIGGKIEMLNHTADNAAKMYMRFKSGGDNERMRIDQNGKVIVASGTLHSTRVLARFGIDCHGMDIYDGVGVVANYGMAFYNDPTTNKANGIGFFNDDGQTCGGYIVHQDKGGSNIGDLIMATAASANTPVERLRIESGGNIKQNLTSPAGTSPFLNSHWYDRDGGNYTITATDDNSMTAIRTSSGGAYNDLVYKRVRMSKNCDIEFELSGNSPAGIYRHVGFVINGDGTATHANWDRLVFRYRPAGTGSNQIRIDKGGGGYGFNVESSSVPNFFDGNERHVLIRIRERMFTIMVDGVVIISQKTNADLNRTSGWFGFGIYEGGESAQITIRNLTIRNRFQKPHWLARATGVNVDVSAGDPLPFNSTIETSSNMSNTADYNPTSNYYRFTVPISGVYYVFFRVYRNSSSSSEIAFYVNGTVRARFRPNPNNGDYIFAGSCMTSLAKDDTIDVRPYGATLDNFYGNSGEQWSSWGGHLLD